jgi:cytoskeletal protein CcmA (bactofilin family)
VKATQLIELKQPGGRVKGNLEAPALSMDRGVVFEGSCKMENIGGSTPPSPGGGGGKSK